MRSMILAAAVALSTVAATGAATAGPVEAAAPGTIVHLEALSVADLIPGADKGFRIVYRTTGQNGEPELSGGNIYLPAGTPPAGGWRVVSWGHSTSGMTLGCTPNLDGGLADTWDETPQLSTYLAQGYAVEATDYIGLGAPGFYEYLAGRADGHAVLDIVRAGPAVDPALSESFVLAGHSIGGHSVLDGASMAASYAPELDLHGTVSYAPTSNVDDLIDALARPELPELSLLQGFETRVVMILAGLDHARPDLGITDYLTPVGRELLDAATTGPGCLAGLDSAAVGKSLGSLFSRPLSDPAISAALRDYLAVPTTGYQRPVLLLQGVSDTLQPIPTTLLLQQELQQAGVDSRLRVYPSATHFTVLKQADADTRSFVTAVLPGQD